MADGYENHAPENLQVSIQKTQNLSLCFDQILVQLFVYVCIKKQGKYQAMVVCCILGIGSLFSWNSMLTIADYYYQVFPVRFRFWFEFQFCYFVLVINLNLNFEKFVFHVGLSSFKGIHTYIPTNCPWNNHDSRIPRIENQY